MKNEPGNKKLLEEVLCDDVLSEKLINGGSFEKELTDSDLSFSRELFYAIHLDERTLNAGEKDFLGARIADSIKKSKQKRLFSRIGYAASLLVIVGLTFYFASQNKSGLAEYASSVAYR